MAVENNFIGGETVEADTLARLFVEVDGFVEFKCDAVEYAGCEKATQVKYAQSFEEIPEFTEAALVTTSVEVDRLVYRGLRSSRRLASEEFRICLWDEAEGVELYKDEYRMQRQADGKVTLRVLRAMDGIADGLRAGNHFFPEEVSWRDATVVDVDDLSEAVEDLRNSLPFEAGGVQEDLTAYKVV